MVWHLIGFELYWLVCSYGKYRGYLKWMLCALISKLLLCIPLAGQVIFFGIFMSFSVTSEYSQGIVLSYHNIYIAGRPPLFNVFLYKLQVFIVFSFILIQKDVKILKKMILNSVSSTSLLVKIDNKQILDYSLFKLGSLSNVEWNGE